MNFSHDPRNAQHPTLFCLEEDSDTYAQLDRLGSQGLSSAAVITIMMCSNSSGMGDDVIGDRAFKVALESSMALYTRVLLDLGE